MALTSLMSLFTLSAGQAQTGYLLIPEVFVPVSVFLVRWFNTGVLILTAPCISRRQTDAPDYETVFPRAGAG